MADVKKDSAIDLSAKDLAIGFVCLVALVFVAKKLEIGTGGTIALGLTGVVGGIYASKNLTSTSKIA